MRSLPLLLALVTLVATSSLGAPPGPAQERHVTLEAVAVACEFGDGVCLAYDGVVPGPTLDVNLGDTVVLTLVNRIPETLAALDAPDALKARLAQASVSFHVHGTALSADVDGVMAHEGTQLVESVAPPGGSFTYRFRAAFTGAWHYHDHVLGADGEEGVARGLYGSLLVRSGAAPRPAHVLDLHLVDAGANGGRGLDAALPARESFELVLVGLGDKVWTVDVKAPDGRTLARRDLGPGMSESLLVVDPQPGVYRWRATWAFQTFQGAVVVPP